LYWTPYLSTSTYLPLAKVCRLYYICRYSRFTPLLTHQLSYRSPQNSPKVQIKGTTQYSKNKHIKISSNIFYLLSRQLPLALTSKNNAIPPPAILSSLPVKEEGFQLRINSNGCGKFKQGCRSCCCRGLGRCRQETVCQSLLVRLVAPLCLIILPPGLDEISILLMTLEFG
jgi:hypothetical protein